MQMHRINLSESVYEQARRGAEAAGFESVDGFVESVLHDLLDPDNLDHIFTPTVIAQLREAAREAREGHNISTDQMRAELAKNRTQWPKNRAS
jgi:hypothetical protein